MKNGIWEDWEFMVDEARHQAHWEREERRGLSAGRPHRKNFGSRDGLRSSDYIDALENYIDQLETAVPTTGVVR